MTISSVTSKVIYVGTGSTAAAAKIFAYPFKILRAADLTVSEYISATSAATVKTLDTDYVVSGVGSDSGGNVTLTGSYTNLPTSSQLVIQRIVDLTQETDYVENDPFSAETHENALDKLTMATQQLQEQVDRSIKADIAQTSSSVVFTDFVAQSLIATSSATVSVTQASNAYVYAAQASSSAALVPDPTSQTAGYTIVVNGTQNGWVFQAAGGAASTQVNFGSASLSAGVLDITHGGGLGLPYAISVSVFDSAGYMVIPDNVVGSTNTVHIALSTANFTVTGTWAAIYVL